MLYDEIIDKIVKTTKLLEIENKFIDEMNIDEIDKIYPKKFIMISEIEEIQAKIIQNSDIKKEFTAMQKEEFKNYAKALDVAMENNIKKLISANEFNNMMMEVIQNVICPPSNGTYGDDGKISESNKKIPAISVKGEA